MPSPLHVDLEPREWQDRRAWHREFVHSRFDFLALVESLAPPDGDRLLGLGMLAAERRAALELSPLVEWPAIGSDRYGMYREPPETVRLLRVLDYLRPGDRVLDIGCGAGYLGGVILRDARPSHYAGIDLHDWCIASARDMVAANDLDGVSPHVETRDLYDLDHEFVADHRPDVVVMLEVLEHLRDPEKALLHLCEVLPDDALLLVSVPLLRRVEHVWGHLELFGIARVRAAFEDAGFTIQDVDAVHNTWLLVVASKLPDPHPRALDALDRRGAIDAESSPASSFRLITLTGCDVRSDHTRNARATFEVTGRGKACATARAGALPVASAVGLRLPMPDMAIARMDVELEPASALTELTIVATGDGRELASWSVNLRAWADANTVFRRTLVLRPGEPYGPVRPVTVQEGVISDLHVVARLRRGRELRMHVHRSAFVAGAWPTRAPGWNLSKRPPGGLVARAMRFAGDALRSFSRP